MLQRIVLVCTISILALTLWPLGAFAQTTAPATDAETIRAALVSAQLKLSDDTPGAQQSLANAQDMYGQQLAQALMKSAPTVDAQVRAGFEAADQAIGSRDAAGFAVARTHIWMALLNGGYQLTEQALQRNDGATAKNWLALREFRTASRFSRPDANATLAVNGVIAGTTTSTDALVAVRAELLDTYQARLNETLADLGNAQKQGFAVKQAELAALAEGYFQILAPAYAQQRGEPARATVVQQLHELVVAARSGQGLDEARAGVDTAMRGFRAAPLSTEEQARRAGQMLRFLSLVPVEYSRGIRNGAVATPLEIQEASTFRDGAAAAFDDLQASLQARDAAKSAQAAQLFASLHQQIAAATPQSAPDPNQVQGQADQLTTLLKEMMPAEWQRNSSADFDVIKTALDQMETAAVAGQYDLAESARLEAYAVLESGPEAKLVVFAPQHKPILEGLFWNGHGDFKGLADLISKHAPAAEIKATRVALDQELTASQEALVGNNAPAAVASNAAVIVFREGLEAVLILASLMASFKGAAQHMRRPLWGGALLAFLATALTWLLARGVLSTLARYGEKLEAIVSLIAIGVLLLITNWFFHDVYWKGWMAGFHQKKRQIVGGNAGQILGLVILGFTSIYREGFETVLFLQALVLESGTATVLGGVGIGLLATLLVGLIVFVVQAKLPAKKMLIATGIMIGAVLLQMVGNTAHVLQVVGWLPTSPIRWLAPYLPYWTGLWFGLYATWEGIGLQLAAGAFTIGSYYLAEWQNHKKQAAPANNQSAFNSRQGTIRRHEA